MLLLHVEIKLRGDFLKVLIIGGKGMLGQEIEKILNRKNVVCLSTGRKEFDICNYEESYKFIKEYQPTVVIDCAAYNFVDLAEEEIEQCNLVNCTGTRNIADICKNIGAKMVFFSTDYVFDGNKVGEYQVDDKTNPMSVYGKSKAKAEQEVRENAGKAFILRVSWLFGKGGKNFVTTMLDLGKKVDSVRVVSDQVGSPTYTVDLAEFVCNIIETEKYGTYHVTNQGFCSWAEFATKIFQYAGMKTSVISVNSQEYAAKAKRPLNSKLSSKSIDENAMEKLPSWDDALKRFLKEIGVLV